MLSSKVNINPIISVFTEKLSLDEYLNYEQKITFFMKIAKYLDHSRTSNSVGRTPITISKNLDRLIDFLKMIDCTDIEIIEIISESPDILNVDIMKIYSKYLILGSIPECLDNPHFRKDMLIKKPRDFRTGLTTLYARYQFSKTLNYPEDKINWSMLMHDTNSEFAKKFVKNAYNKPYKIYDSSSEFDMYEIKEKYPFSLECLEEFKDLEVNQEIILRTEELIKEGPTL